MEYRADGRLSAFELAAFEYRGFHPQPTWEMASDNADLILEGLLPGVTSNGLATEMSIPAAYPRFSREVRRLRGALLTRDYPTGDDRSRMIVAGLQINGADLGERPGKLVSSLGAPYYQQFAADELAIGVFYGSQGSIQNISMFAEKALLAPAGLSKPIARDAAEILLRDVLPTSIGADKPKTAMKCIGGLKIEFEFYGQLTVCRSYAIDEMIAASINWRES